ncbi:unnamed protein product [Brassica rapa subsp. trilocularis]
MIRKSPESIVFVTVGNEATTVEIRAREITISLFLAPPPSLTLVPHIRLCVSILCLWWLRT